LKMVGGKDGIPVVQPNGGEKPRKGEPKKNDKGLLCECGGGQKNNVDVCLEKLQKRNTTIKNLQKGQRGIGKS